MLRLGPKHRSCNGCCLGWSHPFVWLLTFAAGNSFLQPPTRSPRGHPQKRAGLSLLDSQDSMERKREILRCTTQGSDDIDLRNGMMNARANLAEGRSPGAGLESAYDQADAAYADLIVTSVDNQGIALGEEVCSCATGLLWMACLAHPIIIVLDDVARSAVAVAVMYRRIASLGYLFACTCSLTHQSAWGVNWLRF